MQIFAWRILFVQTLPWGHSCHMSDIVSESQTFWATSDEKANLSDILTDVKIKRK